MQMEVEQPVELLVDNSVVLDASGGSNESVNNADVELEQENALAILPVQQQLQQGNFVLNVGMIRTMFVGPVLPPSLFWERNVCPMLQKLFSQTIPKSVDVYPISSAMLSKRS